MSRRTIRRAARRSSKRSRGSKASPQNYASNVHSVRVESAGFKAGNYARIMMNGVRANKKSGRGLNVVAWTSKW